MLGCYSPLDAKDASPPPFPFSLSPGVLVGMHEDDPETKHDMLSLMLMACSGNDAMSTFSEKDFKVCFCVVVNPFMSA